MSSRYVLLFLLAGIVGAAAALWWWSPARGGDTLASDWKASVRVLAGTGRVEAVDGEARRASFADPFGIAIGTDGAVYVTDGVASHRLRVISPDGVVSTVTGDEAGFVDGDRHAARFDTPSALAVAGDGTLFVADTGNNAIRRVTLEGVSTLAGHRDAGLADGVGSAARFNGPVGIAVDRSGRVVVADTYNDRIRLVTSDGEVTTLAGGEPGYVDGPLADARFDTPSGVAISREGAIYVADTGNDAIRVIGRDGIVSTAAVELADRLTRPVGLALDDRDVLYITDERGRVIEFTGTAARVLAGGEPGFRDGTGEEARFRRPAGVAVRGRGHLVVADTGNGLIRTLVAAGLSDVLVPASPLLQPAFEPDRFAWQPMLWPLEPLEGPFEIAGTLGEARGSGAERFHSGIDVRADQGTRVVAIREGTVLAPVATGAFGTLNEWVRIGPVTYVHLRVGRGMRGDVFDQTRFVATRNERGDVTRMRVRRGARFLTGERIGTVNAFNHVHVNVGWPGEEYNPLLFRLVQFRDTVPPTIAPGGIRLFDSNGQPLSRRVNGRLVVSGRVQIVVDAWDQADGNRADRRLGLYSLGYQVLGRDGTPAPGFEEPMETLRFDRMSASADASQLVYAPGSGIPFYGQRRTRFLYVVTNTFRDGVAQRGFWDTSGLPPGEYTLRIHAADIHGNRATARRDLPVTIVTEE